MVPSGTVTFLFTDIEGSTALWDRFPRLMERALARHDELLRVAFDDSGGYVFSTGGDGFAVAFGSATDAVNAAVNAQRALMTEPWHRDVVVRVRMGLHTGTVEERGGDYYGAAVSRAARIGAVARGSQVVLSAATAMLIADSDWACVDIGEYLLRGFERRERLFCLAAPGLDVVDSPLRRDGDAIGNLPHQRARLVGRDVELRRVKEALGHESLITLVGVGGVGKTRLAVSAAQDAADDFSDGAWLVELGKLTSPGDVAPEVASALLLRLAANVDTSQAVARALGRQKRLVLLDNCEHVIDAAAELIEAIRARCPSVTVLTTSRELLGLDGECSVPVRPLSLDTEGARSDAAQLFCERVEGVLGGFEPNPQELVIVDDICRRLDGLPLALELAAARVPAFGLPELLHHLNDRFELLTRRRGAVERQRSLRTTIAWSYDLLSRDEQLVFDRLSVFAGGFDLVAVESICGFAPLGGRVGDHVASLVERSLLTVVRGSNDTRHQQLETVRQYGEERLESRGESLELRRRHLVHFVAWAEAADAGIRGRDELRWHHRFVAEFHNLRNAVGTAIESNDGDAACRLIWHIQWWSSTRLRLEVGDWADQVRDLTSVADHPLRPIVLAASAILALRRGEWVRAHETIALARDEENRIGEANEPWVPEVAGIVLLSRGPAVVEACVEEVRLRAGNDPFWDVLALRRETLLVWHLLTSYLPSDDEARGHLARARTAVEISEAFGNPTLIANVTGNLGAALQRRDPEGALGLLERAFAIATRVGAESVANGICQDLAYVYASLGRPLDALTLLGPAIRRHARSGAWHEFLVVFCGAMKPLSVLGHHGLVARGSGLIGRLLDTAPLLETSLVAPEIQPELRSVLGDTELDRLLEEGRHLTLADIAEMTLKAIDEVVSQTT